MNELDKKEKELKAKFDAVKKVAMTEEAAVADHSKKLKECLGEMGDLQAQYRLIQELKAKKKK